MQRKIPLKLYNTETRYKEEVTPSCDNLITLYTCGPTVYNYAHIGNFRTYLFEDLLRRTIKFLGFSIRQVMNITDVDDKTLKGAIANGITLEAFTAPYTRAFFEDLKTLNVEPAEEYPRATQYIPQMVQIIAKLMTEGYAYQGEDGSIYYAIDKFPSYGRLSHFHLCDLKAGAAERAASDEYEKENVADFVLWKAYEPERDGAIFWESPFGRGRPGWHIECSAMAMQLLGESIDIHVGGVDNIFPHHENEIAQSEAFSGHRFVRYWLHSEHLLVDHKKMSKSLGNFYTLRDLLAKGYSGMEVRFLLLQTHYRTQLNFTLEGLESARNSLERLSDFVERLRSIKEARSFGLAIPVAQKALEEIMTALADDLNISSALAALFEMVREIHVLCDKKMVGEEEAAAVFTALQKMNQLFGFLPLEAVSVEIPAELQEALQKREEARVAKKWKEADYFRDLITQRGYLIEDTPNGPRLKKR